MSLRTAQQKNSYPLGLNVYDYNGAFIGQFYSNVEIAKALSLSKSTVARYLKKGKLYFK